MNWTQSNNKPRPVSSESTVLPIFKKQVANGQLEKPLATATPKCYIGDDPSAEHFVVLKNLTGPVFGLHFKRYNRVVIDTTPGLSHFPHLTMKVQSAASKTIAKPEAVFFHDSLTEPKMTTNTIRAFVDDLSEWNTTSTVTPVGKFTEAASLLKSRSISTTIDRKIAVRVTNTTEAPFMLNNNTPIAEFSVVTPEPSNFTKLLDTELLSMIPEVVPDLTTYLNEILWTIKPEQQNNAFWFLTPEDLVKIEDRTAIQARILKELHELKEKRTWTQNMKQIPNECL